MHVFSTCSNKIKVDINFWKLYKGFWWFLTCCPKAWSWRGGYPVFGRSLHWRATPYHQPTWHNPPIRLPRLGLRSATATQGRGTHPHNCSWGKPCGNTIHGRAAQWGGFGIGHAWGGLGNQGRIDALLKFLQHLQKALMSSGEGLPSIRNMDKRGASLTSKRRYSATRGGAFGYLSLARVPNLGWKLGCGSAKSFAVSFPFLGRFTKNDPTISTCCVFPYGLKLRNHLWSTPLPQVRRAPQDTDRGFRDVSPFRGLPGIQGAGGRCQCCTSWRWLRQLGMAWHGWFWSFQLPMREVPWLPRFNMERFQNQCLYCIFWLHFIKFRRLWKHEASFKTTASFLVILF